MNNWSQSEMSTYLRCQRKWWLQHVRKLDKVSRKPNALTQGLLAHAGLEHRFGDWEQAIDSHAATMFEEMDPAYHGDIEKQLGLAHVMVEGLIEWAANEGIDAEYEVIDSEVEIVAQRDGYNLIGKVDELVRRRTTGAIGFRDWKTAADFGLLKYASRLVQFPFYQLIMRESGREGGSFGQWVVLRKVGRSARAKPPFYDLHERSWNKAEIDSLLLRVDGIVAEAKEKVRRWNDGEPHQAVFPANPQQSCSWDCPFTDICPMFDDDETNVDFAIDMGYRSYDPLARYSGSWKEQ